MPSRRVVAVAAGLAGLAAAVALVVRPGPGDSNRAPAPVVPMAPAPRALTPPTSAPGPGTALPGPTRTEAGVAMGFTRSPAGAEAAALSFLAAGPMLSAVDDEAADRAQRAMAAEASAEALVAELAAQRAAIVEGFGPLPLRWWAAPLATRVRPEGPEAAEVTVWYVSVVAPAELAPYQDWRTVTRRLVWERGDWRIESEVDTPGPRPAALPRLEPTAPAEFVAALAGFEPPGSAR